MHNIDYPKAMNLVRKETEIQKVILDWLNLQEKTMAWRTGNHSVFDFKKQIYRKKAPHDRGLPDLWFIKKGNITAIEVKVNGAKPSDDQLAWGNKFNYCGGEAFICHSLDEAIEVWKKA